MEVEEETTSNHLQESSIVTKECELGTTDKASSDKELSKSKSNTIEKAESLVSVPVPKSDDLKPVEEQAAVEEENKGKVVEPGAAFGGGIRDLDMIESENVLEEMDDEGVGKEIEKPSEAVVAGGSEVAGSEEVVEEKEGHSGQGTNVGDGLVIEKDKEEENAEGGEGDVPGDAERESGLKVEMETVENVQEVAGADVTNDGGLTVQVLNVLGVVDDKNDGNGAREARLENVEGDKAMEEVEGDLKDGVAAVVKEEGIVAGSGEDVKEEEMMAEEEKVGGVTENLEEEATVADDEKVVGITEEETPMAGDEKVVSATENDEEEAPMADDKKFGGITENNEEEAPMAGDEKVVGVTENNEEEAENNEEEALMAGDEKVVGVTENDEEEAAMADDEKVVGVTENNEKEAPMAGDEKVVGVTENDEEEALVADEEKSLDTEMETEEEGTVANEEKVPDAENETETDLPASSSKGSAGKRKRGGKTSKTTSKSPASSRKTIEEDVCFICFDGGDLVLCDRRNCPKAYHPSCVNRDEAFFQTKGRWNCGWHQCSICEKKADYWCYTCTFSLCKACIKTSVIYCVREKERKGFCEACMKTVMLIENQEPENQGNVDFDDKNSWEHLFKDYWTDTKEKFDLSLVELIEAKNRWKGTELGGKLDSPVAQSDVKDDGGLGSDNLPENLEARKNRRRKAKKRKSAANEEYSSIGAAAVGSQGTSVPNNTEWASKELLEFVMHMRNGDKSVISQFDVQALLLEYIKANKLRDGRRKSQIICDARLERLFGKSRVGHFEMLKLIESHFLIKEDSQIDDIQGSVVDTEVSQVDDEEINETLAKDGKDRKRKVRKKGDKRGPQSNREDYAAIDIHNISVIYLRRKLVEDLLDDIESFHEKIVGTFVRIRIPGNNQNQDIYRLVQVTGTSQAAQYTIGKRTTCTMLEILNLNKAETISIDTISNQDFTEDECKRLRQSIKCGLINRLTVGDILDKAMELQVPRVNDWIETETTRLTHLRDRASDLGRKKHLRECIEKLQVLKTPEERARRLEDFPIIHVDPTMDPNYGSEDDTDSDDKKQDLYKRSSSFRFGRRGGDQFSPRKVDYTSKESWSGTPRSSGRNYEFGRSMSNKNFSTKVEDATASSEIHHENSLDQAKDAIVQPPSILKKPSIATDVVSPTETSLKINETEKMWHYRDPSGKIQGPFSMVQLRKWSKNGYFPVGLRIWRKSDKEDVGILLTDALEGRFAFVEQQRISQDGHNLSHVNLTPTQSQVKTSTTVEMPKASPDVRHDFTSLPSPTPNICATAWTGGQTGPHVGPSSYPSGNEELQSPTPNSAQPASSSILSSVVGGNNERSSKQGIAVGSQNSQLGQLVPAPDNNMPSQIVQSIASQNPPVGTHDWSSGPPQNLQPNPSMNMGGLQQLGYNQWGGVPNMVQNPAGNFLPQSATAAQQPEPWGQLPAPVNQPNMQQPPPQPNWGTMPANPNMGWVGPTPGNPHMNWGAAVQGPQMPGNVNPAWVMQAGQQGGGLQMQGPVPGNVHPSWVPGTQVQGVPPNQGWVQGPVVAGNGNPGWVGPPGTQGAPNPNPAWVGPPANQGPTNTNTNTNTNTGWVSGPGNQGAPPVQGSGPGNNNMGWGPPSGNQGVPCANTNQGFHSPAPRNRSRWRDNEPRPYNNRGFQGRKNRGPQGGGYGYRGHRRHWDNKPEPFHKDGGSGGSARSSEQ